MDIKILNDIIDYILSVPLFFQMEILWYAQRRI